MSRELELITGAVLADGRPGALPAEPGDGPKHAGLHTECLNCGETLHGRFCARCGQPSDDHHRSILHLAWETVEGFTHLDGRLAKTVPPLFFRPGSLARDHFEGRRQRHVPPLRLFLVSLLLFMLALEFVVHRGAAGLMHVETGGEAPQPGVHVASVRPGATVGSAAQPAATATPAAPLPPGVIPPKAPAPPEIDPAYAVQPGAGDLASQAIDALDVAQPTNGSDAISALEKSGAAKNPIARWFLARSKAAGVSPEYFTTVMFEWAHRLAVLLLPIFALLLTVCYFYRRRFYIYDHLVVSMQFLSFIFLVSATAWVLPAGVRGPAVTIATLWTPVNLFMVLRGAYGSSVAGALVKTALLWVSTLCLFAMLLLGILVVTLSQMR